MATNPFDFSKKTFIQIYNELNTLYPGKPDWFKILVSGRADVLHWYLDARANNLYIDSAYTREAMVSLCKLINYELSGVSSSSATVTVTLKSGTSLPKTITKDQLIAQTTGSTTETPIRFEALADHQFTTLSEGVEFQQGLSISSEFLGQSDGSIWQEFNISRKNVIIGSSSMLVGAVAWTEITDFIEYDNMDKVYRIYTRDDDTAFIRFGNDQYGMIPPQNFDITLSYKISDGANGNVAAGKINTYLGQDTDVESVTNAAAATGGAAKENIEEARRLAPLELQTRDRTIRKIDIKALSEGFDGVARVGVLANYYGVLSTAVQVIPYGGGNPSSQLKTDLQTYLIDRSILESIDIRCENPQYVSVNITAGVKILTGATWATVQAFVKCAFYLIVTEKIGEILDTYNSEGIAAAVIKINNFWSFSFGSADYNQLDRIINNMSERAWGQDIYLSDLYAPDAYVDGVDYITITVPSGTVTIDYDEISTEGTITVNQL